MKEIDMSMSRADELEIIKGVVNGFKPERYVLGINQGQLEIYWKVKKE